MKNKKIYFYLFLFVLLGLLIRLSSLDKPEGLWNDEYISWYISTKPLFKNFLKSVFQNCHMPFYYCYLKLWSFVFGDNDLSLRISSVFPGVLSIISMFFAGKKLKDINCGLCCAFYTAVSGFLIYFSQEVRFYSILFFFSSLAILFMLHLSEKQNRFNYFGFCLSNILIILTHTIGFVFVFFNYLFLILFLKKKNQIDKYTIISIIASAVISILPFIPFLYKTLSASYISQFWSDFSFTKLFFVFADYVSPIQINLVNTPLHISSLLFKSGKFNFGYFIFAVIPLSISFIGLCSAIRNKTDKLIIIALSALSTLLIMIAASVCGKLVLITKYTVEIYPAFILITMFGFCSLKNYSFKKFLSVSFFGLILFYTFVSDFAPQKLKRPEGHKLPANLITEAKLHKNDKILLLYYDKERFGKYLNLSDYFIDSVTKYNFQYKLINNPPAHYEIIKNGKSLFFDSFKSSQNDFFKEFLKNYFFKNMKKGDKFALVKLNSVTFVTPQRMKEVTSNEQFYKRIPFLFLIFSHISNMTQSVANDELSPVFNKTEGKWEIIVWEKK